MRTDLQFESDVTIRATGRSASALAANSKRRPILDTGRNSNLDLFFTTIVSREPKCFGTASSSHEKSDVELVPKVGPSARRCLSSTPTLTGKPTGIEAAAGSAATGTLEEVPKDAFKGLGVDVGPGRSAPLRTRLTGSGSRVTVAVVLSTFLLIGKHVVGFLDFGKSGRRVFSFVDIRMKLSDQATMRLSKFILRGIFGDAKDFVVVSFTHDGCP